MKRRHERELNGLNRDDLSEDLQGEESGRALLEQLERVIANSTSAESVKINDEFYSDDVHQIQPKVGLPTDCSIVPHWRANVIKPQISFRSNLDEDAVILVAVDEISFQGFAVKDATGLDPIATDVLSRNYVGLKGLQAFYPTKEVSQQNCVPDIRTGQLNPDFLPLEVFLDVRSETTEYDRIVLKTDISLAIDRFNSLRVPRGLEWPEVYDEVGEPIEHLRKHQNSTTIIVPMLTVSARPNHYAALYYIVTDFMRYRDPEIDKRNEKITNFMYKFDQRDRDPQQLLSTLFVMQQHIRGMTELQRGYELNVDRLTDEGKRELFRIRTDLLHESDALFTVFEVINLNRAIDDARNNARTLSRIDIRMGNLAWHMLRDNGEPLLKFNIKQVLSAIENNQDGSTDSAIVFGDLQALNSNATAVFPEVLSRWEKPKKKVSHMIVQRLTCRSLRPSSPACSVCRSELAVSILSARSVSSCNPFVSGLNRKSARHLLTTFLPTRPRKGTTAHHPRPQPRMSRARTAETRIKIKTRIRIRLLVAKKATTRRCSITTRTRTPMGPSAPAHCCLPITT